MAGSVDAIIQNLLAGTGYGHTPSDFLEQGQQIQRSDQQLQIGKMQLAAASQEQQEAQQYSQDVSAWVAAGSPPEALPALAVKYPKQYQAIKAGWDLKDKAQQTADLNFFGQAYAAANNGRTDLAKAQLVARRDAEKEAGIDTKDLDDLIGQFDTDAKGAVNTLKSVALAHIYAGDKDGFAKAFGLGADKTHVITAGGALVDDTGRELYKANEKPTYQKVDVLDGNGLKIGERIVELGGGGTGAAPGGAEGAPRSVRNNNPGNIEDGEFAKSQPGYVDSDGRFAKFETPEAGAAAQTALLARYGSQGRNTVAKVVSKWAPASDGNNVGAYAKFVAQKLGVHPNQALDMSDPKTLNGLQMAMAQFEGGSQSKSNGQPQGGGQGDSSVVYDSSAGGAKAGGSMGDMTQSGDAYLATLPQTVSTQVKALADGRLPIPSGFALSKPYWQKMLQMVAQYDPTFDAANAQTRVKTRKEFTSGKAAANITSFNTVLHHIDTLQHAAEDLNNWSIPLINKIGNAAAKATGDPRVDKFNSAKQAVVDELERSFRGTSGTLAGIKGWEESISASSSPAQIHGVLTQMADLLAGRIEALGEQYKEGMGKSIEGINLLDSKARSTLKRLGSGYGDAQAVADTPAPTAGAPQGAKLIGTHKGAPVYQLPDGRKWTP